MSNSTNKQAASNAATPQAASNAATPAAAHLAAYIASIATLNDAPGSDISFKNLKTSEKNINLVKSILSTLFPKTYLGSTDEFSHAMKYIAKNLSEMSALVSVNIKVDGKMDKKNAVVIKISQNSQAKREDIIIFENRADGTFSHKCHVEGVVDVKNRPFYSKLARLESSKNIHDVSPLVASIQTFDAILDANDSIDAEAREILGEALEAFPSDNLDSEGKYEFLDEYCSDFTNSLDWNGGKKMMIDLLDEQPDFVSVIAEGKTADVVETVRLSRTQVFVNTIFDKFSKHVSVEDLGMGNVKKLTIIRDNFDIVSVTKAEASADATFTSATEIRTSVNGDKIEMSLIDETTAVVKHPKFHKWNKAIEKVDMDIVKAAFCMVCCSNAHVLSGAAFDEKSADYIAMYNINKHMIEQYTNMIGHLQSGSIVRFQKSTSTFFMAVENAGFGANDIIKASGVFRDLVKIEDVRKMVEESKKRINGVTGRCRSSNSPMVLSPKNVLSGMGLGKSGRVINNKVLGNKQGYNLAKLIVEGINYGKIVIDPSADITVYASESKYNMGHFSTCNKCLKSLTDYEVPRPCGHALKNAACRSKYANSLINCWGCESGTLTKFAFHTCDDGESLVVTNSYNGTVIFCSEEVGDDSPITLANIMKYNKGRNCDPKWVDGLDVFSNNSYATPGLVSKVTGMRHYGFVEVYDSLMTKRGRNR